MGLFFIIQSIGCLLGAGLFAAVMAESSNETKDYTSNPFLRNLKFYFFLLAGIAFLTWVLFIFVSYRLRILYSRNSSMLTRQPSISIKHSRNEPSSYASISWNCWLWLNSLTLSVPVVFLNSPNLSSYFSLNKFERIWLLIFSSWLCLINSHFLITKCHILYVLYKEKLVVDNWLALKGLS